MDSQRRSRSPSAGHANNIRRSPSPSPHLGFNNHANALGLDPSLLGQPGSFSNSFNNQPPPNDQPFFDPSSTYHPQQNLVDQYATLSDPSFMQSSQDSQSQSSYHFGSQQNSLGAGEAYNSIDNLNAQFPGDTNNSGQDFDSSIYLDPSMLDSQGGNNQAANNPAFMNNMAAVHRQSPEPPHLLQPGMRQSSSNHSSPSAQQGDFSSSIHARNTSLDPASAAYPRSSGEWTGTQFSHHRSPSDHHSDVSSQPSPYLGTVDQFDLAGQHSPLMNGQPDPSLFPTLSGMNQISLSDPQMQPQHTSAGPSPHLSPNLYPQQQELPQFTPEDNFGLSNSNATESFPNMQNHPNGSGEFGGHADQLSPPEISIEFAPPSREPTTEDMQNARHGALSPPERSHSRSRPRARSDPYSLPHNHRGASPLRSRSPSLGLPQNSLSPYSSRSNSPAPVNDRVSFQRRSSSPSFQTERDRMLALAEPNLGPGDPSASPGSDNASVATRPQGRVQKHPATFQCSLCPKRFTRAYNLRSHLRTHTDERPFVCTVCGKAFARQHDRKRHEGLHSGEKKFVCKGTLAGGNGGTWGCGRRFARADALGRHFRSEAGRSCIKPLLDEEARERQAAMMDQANQDMLNSQAMPQGGYADMAQNSGIGGVDYSNIPLPAALLQQYPALAGIWDQIPTGMGGAGRSVDDNEYESQGRSSFDANSGGEFDDYDDGGGGGGYVSDIGGYSMGVPWGNQATSYNNGWASDIDGQ